LAQRKEVTVIARDPVMRRSLAFALDAEGFRVEAYADLGAAFDDKDRPRVCCTIVDDDGLVEDSADLWRMGGLASPVLLLMDPIKPFPGPHAARVLLKPYAGLALVETVRELSGGLPPA
jgi:hypothetical protein